MAIKEGDRLPDATFMTYGPEGPRPITAEPAALADALQDVAEVRAADT